MSLGLMHVQRLRDVIRTHLHDPLEFAAAWDAATEADLVPWYRENVEEDHARMVEIDALRTGLEPPRRRDRPAILREALRAAVPRDPDVFRAFLASRCCLTPLRETFADDRLVERVLYLAARAECPAQAGPGRKQLLQLVESFDHRGVPARSRRSGDANSRMPASTWQACKRRSSAFS
jgi:hypothetical protein